MRGPTERGIGIRRLVMSAENIVSREFTEIRFVDQYGDERIIHRNRGQALRIKKREDSVCHILNREAAKIIGRKIRERRQAAGMTLDELLAKAGLAAAPGQGKQRMWTIENAGKGRARANLQGVRFGTLYAIAIALECEPWELMPSASEIADRAGVALVAPTHVRLSTS